MVEIGRKLWEPSSVNPPTPSSVTLSSGVYSCRFGVSSGWTLLDTSRQPVLLFGQPQSKKGFFLMFKGNFLGFSLCPYHLVLSLDTTKRNLFLLLYLFTPSWQGICTYWYDPPEHSLLHAKQPKLSQLLLTQQTFLNCNFLIITVALICKYCFREIIRFRPIATSNSLLKLGGRVIGAYWQVIAAVLIPLKDWSRPEQTIWEIKKRCRVWSICWMSVWNICQPSSLLFYIVLTVQCPPIWSRWLFRIHCLFCTAPVTHSRLRDSELFAILFWIIQLFSFLIKPFKNKTPKSS